ncbi:hypothetical protein RJ639_024063 [Escallonia herrerae]|uniref:Gem-associated protein 2 n=1 Tax=Escallonia herrerae TaxID=1293975 RepID=A0AA88V0S7_9ASTE|nr:hypothetical protein RJ639_024063 [Escallonia herrerae]
MGAANYPKWNGDQKNVKQEMDGKNEKRSRKRGGKGRKKRMVEAQNGFQKKGSGSEHVYSMKEMEALRFVNVDEQRKKWIEVYCGLGPAVVGEYDGLVDCNYQKQFEVNFDPRQQFRRKEAAHATCGDEVSDNMDLGFQSMDTLDPAHGLSCSHIDGCTAVQEEFSEDDEGDAGYSSILRPAFLVTGEPDFDSGPPQDGLEFIRRVRWEAERIPNVKVAKVERSKLKKEQTIYMPRIPDIPKCPEQLMPLKQWEDAFLADFSELRLALSCNDVSCATISGELQSVAITHEEECLHKDPNRIIPEKIAEEECLHKDLNSIILERIDDLASHGVDSCQPIDLSAESFSTANGNDLSPALTSPSFSFCVGFDSSPSPALSAILGMDSVARVSMLKKRIKSVETTSSLSRDDCAWLFALCAAVDTPLDADTSAALRSLLRRCACLRAEKSELDDEAVMLNILVTISGKYFGQSEGP